MAPDRIYSILTAFPAMMLIAALVLYYKAEGHESSGELILEQSRKLVGHYKGVSGLSSNSSQYYLWVNTGQRVRGLRIFLYQLEKLSKQLEAGQSVIVWTAPRVDGSKVLWVEKIIVGGKNLLSDLE